MARALGPGWCEVDVNFGAGVVAPVAVQVASISRVMQKSEEHADVTWVYTVGIILEVRASYHAVLQAMGLQPPGEG